MTAELSSEQIVTNLLTSNEILHPKKGNFYISNSIENLGDYLLTLPPEELEIENCKYSFITSKWSV